MINFTPSPCEIDMLVRALEAAGSNHWSDSQLIWAAMEICYECDLKATKCGTTRQEIVRLASGIIADQKIAEPGKIGLKASQKWLNYSTAANDFNAALHGQVLAFSPVSDLAEAQRQRKKPIQLKISVKKALLKWLPRIPAAKRAKDWRTFVEELYPERADLRLECILPDHPSLRVALLPITKWELDFLGWRRRDCRKKRQKSGAKGGRARKKEKK